MEQFQDYVNLFKIDWASLNWSQMTQINDFQWNYGITPFSHFQFIVFMTFGYLISLFALQSWMKERKAFTLKYFTFVHNIFLTCLSTVMFIGVFYGAILKYQSQGFWSGLVCEQDPQPIKGPLFYWSYIFFLSKFYEFIDSYLLVLKKKPLIFLHVYHHFVMPYVCWAGLDGAWCMALWTSAFWNSFVHILMYYYYAVSTIGYSPWWKKYLTGIQIYQFVSGVLYTGIYFYYYFKDLKINFTSDGFPEISYNQGCVGDFKSIAFMFFVNCSFLLLFSKFYVESYSNRSNPNSPRETRKNK